LIETVLVVCVGNVCRSPVAAQLLATGLIRNRSNITVSSAGISAMAGREIDPIAAEVAKERGMVLQPHAARQFTTDMGKKSNLILVMEPGHGKYILQKSPQLSGRVMLFDHWTGARGISDPYKQSREFHEMIFARLSDAAQAWVEKLSLGQRAMA
jgi:protein-tyrosine phosphatase